MVEAENELIGKNCKYIQLNSIHVQQDFWPDNFPIWSAQKISALYYHFSSSIF